LRGLLGPENRLQIPDEQQVASWIGLARMAGRFDGLPLPRDGGLPSTDSGLQKR
jgi:hypothetical protein